MYIHSKVKPKNTIVHVHGILQFDRGEPDEYEFVKKTMFHFRKPTFLVMS